MRREAISDFFIANHKLYSTENENMDIFDQIGGSSVYEVIKIVDGIPLFFEEHIGRMKNSARLSEMTICKNENEIMEEISMLVKNNRCKNINVKLVQTWSEGKSLFLTCFIRSEYPGRKVYAQGIHTILFQGERKSPHIKTISSSFRDKVRKAREISGAYEALLVDEAGYIAEGSRSNIFFLKQGRIYTPPIETVLPGVTRRHVMQVCKTLETQVREEPLHFGELPEIEGAFITGTTVDVLPISSVDDRKILSASAPLIQKIKEQYDEEVKTYVTLRQAQGQGQGPSTENRRVLLSSLRPGP